MSHPGSPATYESAGVDLDAADKAMALIGPLARSTHRPEVLAGIGGFAGLFELAADRYRRPVLVASTDGIGTKSVVAHQLGRFDTVGRDLVAMCVDDMVCEGAEPLFLLDNISVGDLDAAQVVDLVTGVADGCRLAGAALLGGETAEHTGVMEPGEFDLAGFAVGVVERDNVLGAGRVRVGDVLVGLPSPGLRCNGYTLARHVLCERAGLPLEGPAWPGATVTLGEELLRPSVIYTPAVRAAIGASEVHAVAHITGGGFPGNIPRILPDDTRAVLDRSTWELPGIFSEIRRLGAVSELEMSRVFNLGLGMVMVVAQGSEGQAMAAARSVGIDARVVGGIESAESGEVGSGAPSSEAMAEGRLAFVGPTFWPEDGGQDL
ncbi:MAG: phosphoribosylformylglycinamidine cyclo-ligase [Acidimicrobiales bacterium]